MDDIHDYTGYCYYRKRNRKIGYIAKLKYEEQP